MFLAYPPSKLSLEVEIWYVNLVGAIDMIFGVSTIQTHRSLKTRNVVGRIIFIHFLPNAKIIRLSQYRSCRIVQIHLVGLD